MDALRKGIENQIGVTGPAMLAMSILSDAQEVLDRGNEDLSRQFMNRAKFIIGQYLMPDPPDKKNTMENWQSEVANGDTFLGLHDWRKVKQTA